MNNAFYFILQGDGKKQKIMAKTARAFAKALRDTGFIEGKGQGEGGNEKSRRESPRPGDVILVHLITTLDLIQSLCNSLHSP
jgi:hypothetical protein